MSICMNCGQRHNGRGDCLKVALIEKSALQAENERLKAERDRAVALLRKARDIGPMHTATVIEVDAFLAGLDRKDKP